MSTPDRMIHRHPCLRINVPDLFEDEDFVAWLNHPESIIATWHVKGQKSNDYSDIYVSYDNGEGSDADMPEHCWDLICKICEEEGFRHGILHLTNLEY